MSIVAAARHGDRVVVGCDTLVAAGDLTSHSTTKIHRFGGALLGVVGECRVELRLVRQLRRDFGEQTVAPETVSEVVLGFTKRDRAAVELLLVADGRLWTFEDGHPSEVVEPYWAIGAAQWVALGAMHARLDLDASDTLGAVNAALSASAEHCRGCVGAPFIVERL